MGCEILKAPARMGAESIRKGAIILSSTDEVCSARPDIGNFFYIVERRGWSGMTSSSWSDVKFVEDRDTWRATAERYPNAILLDLGAADFVSTENFMPLGVAKVYTAIQIARWDAFKRHGLYLGAAALLPQHRFLKFGHFAWGGTDRELTLRDKVLDFARTKSPNVDCPYAEARTNDALPMGESEVNGLINRCKMGIITSQDEGINKFKMECMAADIPVLIPSDCCTPLRKHVTPETGVSFEPTLRGLAAAIVEVVERLPEFTPRRYLLQHTGSARASRTLQDALNALCRRNGQAPHFDDIQWDGRRHHWGEEALSVIDKAVAQVSA